MTSGNEPQIGGHDNDRVPMISSVKTRVIADARGAYLAGNLDALIDALNEEQRFVFRQTIVRQAIDAIETLHLRWRTASPTATNLPSDWATTISHHSYDLQRSREWLTDPRIEIVRGVFSVGSQSTPQHKPVDSLADLTLSATVEPSLHDAAKSVRIAIVTTRWQADQPDAQAQWQTLERESRRWQVEAAWRILRGQAFGEIEYNDLERAYRAGSLDALWGSMDEQQRLRLRIAAVQTILPLIQSLMTSRVPEQFENFIRIVNEWILQPTFQNAAAVAASLADLQPQIDDITADSSVDWEERAPVRELETHSRHLSDMINEDDVNHLRDLICNLGDFELDYRMLYWFIEIAWAILHGAQVQALNLNE